MTHNGSPGESHSSRRDLDEKSGHGKTAVGSSKMG